MSSNDIKNLHEEDVEKMFKEEHLVIAGKANIATMRFLTERATEIEKVILKKVKLRTEYKNLLTVPGIGKILALTIMLETGEIERFQEAFNPERAFG